MAVINYVHDHHPRLLRVFAVDCETTTGVRNLS